MADTTNAVVTEHCHDQTTDDEPAVNHDPKQQRVVVENGSSSVV
jgi:hypothetical protein